MPDLKNCLINYNNTKYHLVTKKKLYGYDQKDELEKAFKILKELKK